MMMMMIMMIIMRMVKKFNDYLKQKKKRVFHYKGGLFEIYLKLGHMKVMVDALGGHR